jgi:hypothetical protein
MTENSRPRGVRVYPMTEIPEVNGPLAMGRYALLFRYDAEGQTDASAVRMVHTEGVAYLVTDEKPWCWTDYDTSVESFTPAQLIEKIDFDTANGIDLADWVHTFGARLESNFHQCYWWATEFVEA